MKHRKENFLCSLAWSHISVRANGRLRLCCHDEEAEVSQSPFFSELKAPHLRHDHSFYKNIQKQMKAGEVPKNCQSCFRLEEAGIHSPRYEYNSKFSNNGSLEYLDLTLDNNCNLKCRMCTPKYSRSIEKDWSEIGIPLSMADREALENPPVGEWLINTQANEFWEEAAKTLKLVTLTGGEPFLSPYLDKLLDIMAPFSDKVELRFYSNTTVFPEKLKVKLERFKKITIFCSLDGEGETSNYIRYPSQWNKIADVYLRFLRWSKENSRIDIRVHTVVQAYNIGHLIDLFTFLRDIDSQSPIIPALSLIESPQLFCLNVLPIKELEKAKDGLQQFVLDNESALKQRHKEIHQSQLKSLFFND